MSISMGPTQKYRMFHKIFNYELPREKFHCATPKFLSASPIFGLLGVALRKIRCGASKCRCGDKEIDVVVVIRLIEVKEIAYLQWR